MSRRVMVVGENVLALFHCTVHIRLGGPTLPARQARQLRSGLTQCCSLLCDVQVFDIGVCLCQCFELLLTKPLSLLDTDV